MNAYLKEYIDLIGGVENLNYDIYKGYDPKRFEVLMKAYSRRNDLIAKYSFAIPDDVGLQTIKKYSPIVEMGSGSGYWAYCLSQIGVDILCYDDKSWKFNRWEKIWHEPIEGSAKVLSNHKDRSLLLCWPPYNKPMAYQCLKAYKGDTVIYIGEGPGGCTGDDKFFALLEKDFEEVESISIPQWEMIHDVLIIYRRKN